VQNFIIPQLHNLKVCVAGLCARFVGRQNSPIGGRRNAALSFSISLGRRLSIEPGGVTPITTGRDLKFYVRRDSRMFARSSVARKASSVT
jgi:hypothetical protein